MNRQDTQPWLIILPLLLTLGAVSFAAKRVRTSDTHRQISANTQTIDREIARLRIYSLCEEGYRYQEGEPLARRGLEMRERGLGPDDMGVAADVAALAAILDGEGKRDEAKRLYRRALSAFERAGGPESYDVAINLNNLAALYQGEGKMRGA